MSNEDRNAKIIRDVAYNGMSYGEAAEKHGVSRAMVAGVCYRAGVKTGGIRNQHRVKLADLGKINAGPRLRRWHAENPEHSRRVVKALHAGRDRYFAERVD